jgi:hypothetical protein
MYEHIAKIGTHGTRYAVAGPLSRAGHHLLAVPLAPLLLRGMRTQESARTTDLFLHCPRLIRPCRKGAIRPELNGGGKAISLDASSLATNSSHVISDGAPFRLRTRSRRELRSAPGRDAERRRAEHPELSSPSREPPVHPRQDRGRAGRLRTIRGKWTAGFSGAPRRGPPRYGVNDGCDTHVEVGTEETSDGAAATAASSRAKLRRPERALARRAGPAPVRLRGGFANGRRGHGWRRARPVRRRRGGHGWCRARGDGAYPSEHAGHARSGRGVRGGAGLRVQLLRGWRVL